MPFTEISFWGVFPIVFGLYWSIPAHKSVWRKCILVFISHLLYLAWNPASTLVLLLVTLITYFGGRVLGKLEYGRKRRRTCILLTTVSVLPLLLFKYADFVNHYLSLGLEHLGVHFSLPGLNWVIPLGISFYTFQAVGYLLDVYHGRIQVEKNVLDYTLFVSFFPQLIAGPISTAEELLPQIKSPKPFDSSDALNGMRLIIWGMLMKLVVADRLGIFVDYVWGTYPDLNGGTCLIAACLFSIQIYCDFAGYSLMAIGIADTLGYRLPVNFQQPYFSQSVTEFWKRWHITLTRWLTRNVYIPLGGNRRGKIREYLNVIVTFLVSGIWHGANLTFVVWGILHGMLLVVEKLLGWNRKQSGSVFERLLRILLVFSTVTITWFFFRAPGMPSAIKFISRILTDFGTPDISVMAPSVWVMPVLGMVLVLLHDIQQEYRPRLLSSRSSLVRGSFYVLLFCMVINWGVLDGGAFIYMGF